MDWKRIRRIVIGRWNWKRPFISLASIYILLAITACSFADRIIFQPPPRSYTSELAGLKMMSEGGTEPIALIHLKAPPGAPTIIYSHGNAEDIGQNMDIFMEWHDAGFGVIAYDYPGYGLSPGISTETTTEESIKRVWDYAVAAGIPPSSLVIIGRSIGSGPSVWLASSVDPAGLILISPLKSAFTTAIPLPFAIFPGDRFPNLKRIKNIKTPLLVIHGENDRVIPASHGRAIHENSPAARKSFIGIPDAGHNDLFAVGPDEIFTETSVFIKEVTESSPSE